MSMILSRRSSSLGCCLVLLTSSSRSGLCRQLNNATTSSQISSNSKTVVYSAVSTRFQSTETTDPTTTTTTAHTKQQQLESSTLSPDSHNTSSNRPMTVMERAKRFPGAVKELYQECMLYKNIHDASRTKLNAWTVDHPTLKKQEHKKKKKQESTAANATVDSAAARPTTTATTTQIIYKDEEARHGRIPRRQHEQQRRLIQELYIVSPLVLLWLLPIVGYIPMFLAFAAPRQVLSRHFLNLYEIQQYRELEMQHRKLAYSKVAELFWNKAIKSSGRPEDKDDSVKFIASDASGPVLDLTSMYDVFSTSASAASSESVEESSVAQQQQQQEGQPLSTTPTSTRSLVPGALSSLKNLSREYLVQLAMAIGVNQRLPTRWSIFLTRCTMSYILRFRIRRIAKTVVQDDALLMMEQKNTLNNATTLTDEEVKDACLMRGLPISGIGMEEMRECLSNHLKMVAQVKETLLQDRHRAQEQGILEDEIDEGFGLFTLHLPILRDYYKRQQEAKLK
jgi:hypothetical protein